MSILCQEILKRHGIHRSAELAEKRRHVLLDFMEWAGVLTLVAILLSDHNRAVSILRLLVKLLEQ